MLVTMKQLLRPRLSLTILALFALMCPVMAAGSKEPTLAYRWSLRMYVANAEADLDDDGRSNNEYDEGAAIGFGAELRLGQLVGLEFSNILAAWDSDYRHHDQEGEWHHDDDMGMVAFLFGVNFHVVRGSHVDFYLGPVAGFGALGDSDDYHDDDERWGNHRRHEADGVGLLGINLGLDVTFGRSKQWALHFSVKGLGSVSDSYDYWDDWDWDHWDDDHNHHDHDDEADFGDITFVAIGAGYRF